MFYLLTYIFHILVTQYLGNALIEVIASFEGQFFTVPSLTAACKEKLGIKGDRRALQGADGDNEGQETPDLPSWQFRGPDGTLKDIDGNSGSDSNSDGTGSSGGTQAPTPTPRKPIYETVDEIDVIVKETDGKVDGIIQNVLTPMKATVDEMSDTIGSKIADSVAPIETSVSNTESAVNLINKNVDDMSSTVGGMSASIVSEIDGKVDGVVLNVLTPMKTTVDEMSDTIGTKINATVAPIESAVNFMQGEVNYIKEQVKDIKEINALMHEILNRTLAPTLSPSQSPSRSVSCKVVPFVFHTQYIPHLTTCFLFFYILLISQPTSSPSLSPSQNPSKRPSRSPTVSPSTTPSQTSALPSTIPSESPSLDPTTTPSMLPSVSSSYSFLFSI